MEKDQERQLIEYAKNRDKKSIELLINANKGFLIKIVKYYAQILAMTGFKHFTS